MVTVDTKLISLLGYPLKQTFAPQMFNETFKKLNMDYFYFPIEIENDKPKTQDFEHSKDAILDN